MHAIAFASKTHKHLSKKCLFSKMYVMKRIWINCGAICITFIDLFVGNFWLMGRMCHCNCIELTSLIMLSEITKSIIRSISEGTLRTLGFYTQKAWIVKSPNCILLYRVQIKVPIHPNHFWAEKARIVGKVSICSKTTVRYNIRVTASPLVAKFRIIPYI